MSSSARLFRWVILVPAVFAGWQISLIIGMAIFATAEALCPEQHMVSGLCTAGWFRWAEAGIFMFSAGLAATLMVVAAAWVTPSHRAHVACVVFVGGCLLAGYLGWATGAWAEFVAAVGAGLTTLLVVIRRNRNI